MEIKWQSNKKATTNTRSKNKNKTKSQKKKQTDEHSKTQQKPTDCNRMATVDTLKQSWKNAVLANYSCKVWLTHDRSGNHVALI